MKILAVDTTSLAGSVALLEDDALRGLVGFSTVPGHAERLLPTVDSMLAGLSLSLSDLDAFAVAVGPGSFTGLRIGISTVEGLSYSTGRPVVGVSSLEATAHRYRYRPGWIAAFLDARRSEVFGALFRSDGKHIEAAMDPVCEAPERFLTRLPEEPVLIAGSGLPIYREHISKFKELQPAEPGFFLAEEVARIGRRRHENGEMAPLGKLEAVYIRPSDAEMPKRAKKP
jgi:tRNA threonylcarbamoyladenosine biosynthesis protein TsaB